VVLLRICAALQENRLPVLRAEKSPVDQALTVEKKLSSRQQHVTISIIDMKIEDRTGSRLQLGTGMAVWLDVGLLAYSIPVLILALVPSKLLRLASCMNRPMNRRKSRPKNRTLLELS